MANEKRLIDVNEVIEELTEERNNDCNRYMYSYQKEERDAKYDFAIDWLRDAPTVEAVEVVHGRWRAETEAEQPHIVLRQVVCSVCDGRAHGRGNYCPNCGAKMNY